MRVTKRPAKQHRIAGKKGNAKGVPSAEDLQGAQQELGAVAAFQKKRGFAKKRATKRRKARRG